MKLRWAPLGNSQRPSCRKGEPAVGAGAPTSWATTAGLPKRETQDRAGAGRWSRRSQEVCSDLTGSFLREALGLLAGLKDGNVYAEKG